MILPELLLDAPTVMVDPVPWARSQMAFTLAFHIILVPLGVSWSVMTLIANYRGLRKDDPACLLLAQRWSKYMAVTFAVGAVTGTVLSFEFGLLWPKFMGKWGGAFGVPFAFEGIFFFTEAIFIAIYIFGWDRLSGWAHFWTGVPIVIAGLGGAYSVVAVNAWMAYQLVQDRRAVRVPEDVRPTYERHFAPLTPQEFLRFWNAGEPETTDQGWLVRAGERPSWLYFLTGGRVRVFRDAETITELGAGYFVGEMSLLTGRAANADVAPVGRVETRRWSTSALLDARERDPRLWTKIQSVIGLDLVEKIHLAERRGA